jgi:hypothetical protein
VPSCSPTSADSPRHPATSSIRQVAILKHGRCRQSLDCLIWRCIVEGNWVALPKARRVLPARDHGLLQPLALPRLNRWRRVISLRSFLPFCGSGLRTVCLFYFNFVRHRKKVQFHQTDIRIPQFEERGIFTSTSTSVASNIWSAIDRCTASAALPGTRSPLVLCDIKWHVRITTTAPTTTTITTTNLFSLESPLSLSNHRPNQTINDRDVAQPFQSLCQPTPESALPPPGEGVTPRQTDS